MQRERREREGEKGEKESPFERQAYHRRTGRGAEQRAERGDRDLSWLTGMCRQPESFGNLAQRTEGLPRGGKPVMLRIGYGDQGKRGRWWAEQNTLMRERKRADVASETRRSGTRCETARPRILARLTVGARRLGRCQQYHTNYFKEAIYISSGGCLPLLQPCSESTVHQGLLTTASQAEGHYLCVFPDDSLTKPRPESMYQYMCVRVRSTVALLKGSIVKRQTFCRANEVCLSNN